MKISTNVFPFKKMNDIKLILSSLKEAGFDAYDYSMFESNENVDIINSDNWEEKAIEIRNVADELNISCNQSHAPFPTWRKNDSIYNETMLNKIIRAIRITGILGGKICVVHPNNNATPLENAMFYNKLLPFAIENNVKIGLENMWNWQNDQASSAACSNHEDFLAHLELLDEKWFVANLDIGHAEMKGLKTSSVEMIRTLGHRLEGLHIHDNNLINDLHEIPFLGKINFNEICKELKNVNYSGDVTLEVETIKNLPSSLLPITMQLLAQIANHLKDLINKD